MVEIGAGVGDADHHLGRSRRGVPGRRRGDPRQRPLELEQRVARHASGLAGPVGLGVQHVRVAAQGHDRRLGAGRRGRHRLEPVDREAALAAHAGSTARGGTLRRARARLEADQYAGVGAQCRRRAPGCARARLVSGVNGRGCRRAQHGAKKRRGCRRTLHAGLNPRAPPAMRRRSAGELACRAHSDAVGAIGMRFCARACAYEAPSSAHAQARSTRVSPVCRLTSGGA
jgi:hypothetical protein